MKKCRIFVVRKQICSIYSFLDVGNNRLYIMDNSKIIKVLDLLLKRLHDCQVIDGEKFYTCLDGHFNDVEHNDLEGLVVDLFEEHTRLTDLINDVYDLRTTFKKFGVLFDND